jgi:hypothetical protein
MNMSFRAFQVKSARVPIESCSNQPASELRPRTPGELEMCRIDLLACDFGKVSASWLTVTIYGTDGHRAGEIGVRYPPHTLGALIHVQESASLLTIAPQSQSRPGHLPAQPSCTPQLIHFQDLIPHSLWSTDVTESCDTNMDAVFSDACKIEPLTARPLPTIFNARSRWVC